MAEESVPTRDSKIGREFKNMVFTSFQGMRIVYGSNKGETEERAQRGLTFLGRLCNNEAVTTSAHA